MRKLLGHVIALSALAAASSASATVIYQTGFEPPLYAPGNLTGQDGWLKFGGSNVNVQTAVVNSGVQAVVVDASMVGGQTGPYHSSPTLLSKISLSGDILLTSSSEQRAWQFSAIGAGLVGFSGGLDINPNGDILAITNGFPTVGTFTRDVWHHVDIKLDYGSQTYDLLVDNVLLADDALFCGSNSGCTNAFLPNFDTVIFDTFGSFGNDRGYLDNLVVQTFTAGDVPEPATWAMMILGLGAVGTKMRRRHRIVVTA